MCAEENLNASKRKTSSHIKFLRVEFLKCLRAIQIHDEDDDNSNGNGSTSGNNHNKLHATTPNKIYIYKHTLTQH